MDESLHICRLASYYRIRGQLELRVFDLQILNELLLSEDLVIGSFHYGEFLFHFDKLLSFPLSFK